MNIDEYNMRTEQLTAKSKELALTTERLRSEVVSHETDNEWLSVEWSELESSLKHRMKVSQLWLDTEHPVQSGKVAGYFFHWREMLAEQQVKIDLYSAKRTESNNKIECFNEKTKNDVVPLPDHKKEAIEIIKETQLLNNEEDELRKRARELEAMCDAGARMDKQTQDLAFEHYQNMALDIDAMKQKHEKENAKHEAFMEALANHILLVDAHNKEVQKHNEKRKGVKESKQLIKARKVSMDSAL